MSKYDNKIWESYGSYIMSITDEELEEECDRLEENIKKNGTLSLSYSVANEERMKRRLMNKIKRKNSRNF